MGSLTALKVKAATQPGRYADGDGLFLEVSASGGRRWLLRVQKDGKRRDYGLGSLASVTLADARAAAFEMRRKIAQGIDPMEERRRQREAIPTFREAAKLVHQEHQVGWKNGKHQAQWLKTLESYTFPKLGNRKVNDIEGPAIRDVLAPIWLSKPETARRVRQRIGAVLDWAYAKGFRSSEAPMRSLARGLPRQPKKDRHFEALPYAEVPAFMAKLRERESIGRLALEALILTAARSGEIRGAVWPEIDEKADLWCVPAERMKMGRPHAVPITPQLTDVFKRAEKYKAPCTQLVFPGLRLKNPLSDMTLLKILRDMDLSATVHGFRSAFRDWAAESTDFPGEVCEAALAHTVSNKVEAAYRRTDFLEKRRLLMAQWAEFCLPS